MWQVCAITNNISQMQELKEAVLYEQSITYVMLDTLHLLFSLENILSLSSIKNTSSRVQNLDPKLWS